MKSITKVLLTTGIIASVTTNMFSQSVKAKEWIAQIKETTIPDYKKRFTEEASAAYSTLEINVDFASFGSNDYELSYVHNQIDKVLDVVRSHSQRNKEAKAELEKQIKKITIKTVATEKERSATLKNGELALYSHSFANNYFSAELEEVIYTKDIKSKEWVAQIKESTIPDYKKRYAAEVSSKLSGLEINVDYASFGSNDEELSYVFNQIDKTLDVFRSMANKSKVAKEEIEGKLKKITIQMVKEESKRAGTFKNGELLLQSHSFMNNYFSSELEEIVEKGL